MKAKIERTAAEDQARFRADMRRIAAKKGTTYHRVRVVLDEDYSHETPDGKPLPGTAEEYAKNPIMYLVDPNADPATGARREATYAEYCAYEGNPFRHIVVGVIVERACPTCGKYEPVGSLWGIDFLDQDAEVQSLSLPAEYDETTGRALPGSLGEIVRELLAESGA